MSTFNRFSKSIFSADVVILAVPISLAALGFSNMIRRAFFVDPEWTTGVTPETKEAEDKGRTYRMQYQQFFIGRQRSLFNNEPELA